MDYSALIGIHDVELATPSAEYEEPSGAGASGSFPGGYPSSASPTPLEVTGGVPTTGVHRGSTAEMLASAGDGLGEIFEEKLFGFSTNHTAPMGPPSGLPVDSLPISIGGSGGVGGGMGNEPLTDLSPPNSEDFETMAGGGSAEDGNAYGLFVFLSLVYSAKCILYSSVINLLLQENFALMTFRNVYTTGKPNGWCLAQSATIRGRTKYCQWILCLQGITL